MNRTLESSASSNRFPHPESAYAATASRRSAPRVTRTPRLSVVADSDTFAEGALVDSHSNTLGRSRSWPPSHSIRSVGFVVSTLLIAILGIFFVSVKDARTSPGLVSNTVYTVKSGDTIWSIATRFANGGSVSALEYRLLEETGTTSLTPGEEIRIP